MKDAAALSFFIDGGSGIVLCYPFQGYAGTEIPMMGIGRNNLLNDCKEL